MVPSVSSSPSRVAAAVEVMYVSWHETVGPLDVVVAVAEPVVWVRLLHHLRAVAVAAKNYHCGNEKREEKGEALHLLVPLPLLDDEMMMAIDCCSPDDAGEGSLRIRVLRRRHVPVRCHRNRRPTFHSTTTDGKVLGDYDDDDDPFAKDYGDEDDDEEEEEEGEDDYGVDDDAVLPEAAVVSSRGGVASRVVVVVVAAAAAADFRGMHHQSPLLLRNHHRRDCSLAKYIYLFISITMFGGDNCSCIVFRSFLSLSSLIFFFRV